MNKLFFSFFFVSFIANIYSQKDSLQLGDSYADDQIYAAITYAQFSNQPSSITRSRFSYALSTGFLRFYP
jgi:hypothetical protein